MGNYYTQARFFFPWGMPLHRWHKKKKPTKNKSPHYFNPHRSIISGKGITSKQHGFSASQRKHFKNEKAGGFAGVALSQVCMVRATFPIPQLQDPARAPSSWHKPRCLSSNNTPWEIKSYSLPDSASLSKGDKTWCIAVETGVALSDTSHRERLLSDLAFRVRGFAFRQKFELRFQGKALRHGTPFLLLHQLLGARLYGSLWKITHSVRETSTASHPNFYMLIITALLLK